MADSAYVGLWKQLVDFGVQQAAVGLICDLFNDLDMTEQLTEERRSSEIEVNVSKAEGDGTTGPSRTKSVRVESAKEMKDNSRASLREDAMALLGDPDGQKLKSWLALYQSNRDEFMETAKHWVEHCLDNA